MKKFSLEFCKKFAIQKGGKCLSIHYEPKRKMQWQCSKGHRWEALWSNVYHKSSWCPFCAGRFVTIDEIKSIAIQCGGECLENEYINAKTLMKFRCLFGHEWYTTANRLKNGTWCNNQECISRAISEGKKKYSLKDCQEVASSKNGKCLSTEYISVSLHMRWQCHLGHIWSTTFSKVLGGSWCHVCAKEKQGNRKYTIDDLHSACQSRGFTLLDDKYIGTGHKVRIRCSMGHEWKPVTHCILHQKTGCPYCSKYLTQEKCRYILEILTGQNWIKSRDIVPPFEVDGYCQSLGIAFEYNGEQHYKKHKWHNKGRTLTEQKQRDQKVRNTLKIKGIQLVEIPHWEAEDDKQLIKFIKQSVSCLELQSENVDIEKFYQTYSHCKNELEKIKIISFRRGGKCISKYYVNSNTKLTFQCKGGHEWEATPSKIKMERWCPECKRIKNTIRERTQGRLTKGRNLLEELKEIAQSRNGECLSISYINDTTKLKFKCNVCDNEWLAAPGQIKGSKNKPGTWCPTCSKEERKTKWKRKYNNAEFSLARKSAPKPRKPQLDYNRILSLKHGGMGVKAIGRELGTSHSAVSYALKRIERLGLDWLKSAI